MKKILLSAHRGGPEDRYIPNSLEATNAVRGIGVDLIEFDVRVTKDGKFVTLHDEYVAVNNKSVRVENLAASTVLKYAEGACTLDEMLLAIKDHAIAHVDIKDTYKEVEIVDACDKILGTDGFIITTLEDESVRKIRLERPDVSVALSLGRDIHDMSLVKGIRTRLSEIFPAKRIAYCQPTMLALNYKIARLGVLRWACKHDLPVLLWTLNTPKLIEKAWKDTRIWAFTTNYPRHALMQQPHHAKTGKAKVPHASHARA